MEEAKLMAQEVLGGKRNVQKLKTESNGDEV